MGGQEGGGQGPQSDDAQERTLRPLLVIAQARGAEVFDRVYGAVRIRRAGVDLDQHPEYRSLQAFYELGVRPPTHQEAADIIIGMFGDGPGPARSRVFLLPSNSQEQCQGPRPTRSTARNTFPAIFKL